MIQLNGGHQARTLRHLTLSLSFETMSPWAKLYRKISAHIKDLRAGGCDMPFFRGQANIRWALKPGLARGSTSVAQKEHLERVLYYDFISLSGPLLPSEKSSWNTLFAMQHHGLPTRLLDWTFSFSTALYFALKHPTRKPTEAGIWVLNPFEFNEATCNEEVLLTPPDDFEGSYYQNFITNEHEFKHAAVAINPIRLNTRQVAQESTFTVSRNLSKSINQIVPHAVKLFSLPVEARREAAEFVHLAGVNEYRLFPNLDGLGRHIKELHCK